MTYPKVTEINRRSEWEPEQIAATYAEALTAAEDAGAPNPKACADRYLQGLSRSARSATELEMLRPIPTVCPKR